MVFHLISYVPFTPGHGLFEFEAILRSNFSFERISGGQTSVLNGSLGAVTVLPSFIHPTAMFRAPSLKLFQAAVSHQNLRDNFSRQQK